MSFEKNDRVITPSGEIAKVLFDQSGPRVELEYVGTLIRGHGSLSLPAKLLRPAAGSRRLEFCAK